MICQRFGKLKFLELTLELLQQFKLQMVSMSDEFSIFSGDCSKFCLKCTRCGKCVSSPESVGVTLFNAPSAILFHLDIRILPEDHTKLTDKDASVKLESLPILFESVINYQNLVASYMKSEETWRGAEISFFPSHCKNY
jgi:hypothetical protein